MENFEERSQRRVKEKNIYLLHLDTPRIIIISSAIIGVIVISFLIGMNINNKRTESSEDIFAKKDPLIDLQMNDGRKEGNIFDNSIPNIPLENGITLNTPDNNPLYRDNKDILLKSGEFSKDSSATKEDNNTTDLLTNDNIKEIIPPVKELTKTSKNHAVKSSDKKNNKRKAGQIQKREKKKRIVEVSSNKKRDDSFKSNRRYYSIQVASYYKKSKASAEIKSLKRMSYDAYIDKKSVKGRKYYRVRIGPIYSKKEAISMLNNVQEIDRYEESYMIRK